MGTTQNTRELIIPDSATHIKRGCFAHRKDIKSVVIPKGVKSIGNFAFAGCSSLESITFEEGSALEEIGKEAFWNCLSLKNIVLPKSVTTPYILTNCSTVIEHAES